MFYPFNLNYVMGIKPDNVSNLMLGYDSGWETTGWLPNERKVISFYKNIILQLIHLRIGQKVTKQTNSI